MTPVARQRQNRYRQRKKAAGYFRIELWIHRDLMTELIRLRAPHGPQGALIEFAERGLKQLREQPSPEFLHPINTRATVLKATASPEFSDAINARMRC